MLRTRSDAFVQNDDVIQTVAAYTTNEPLYVGVLPRCSRSDHNLVDAHMPHARLKNRTVYAIAVAQQISWSFIPRLGFHPCCAVHAAVGCSVTLQWITCQRSWARMTSPKSTLHVTVGTVKKSRATNSRMWFFRNAFHVGDGGLRARTRYFSTVDLATSIPSCRSSPTTRGEPQVGLACHISRIKSRTPFAIEGLPGWPLWLRRRQ